MTDRDNIELPPLPPFGTAPIADEQTVRDYARAAVLADRERRAEPAKPAEPEAHRARLILSPKGYAWTAGIVGKNCFTANIRWTDDGRVWIESEKNRELARLMRKSAGIPISDEERLMISAADALDGDVR